MFNFLSVASLILANNKGTDQTALASQRLSCSHITKSGFLARRTIARKPL